MPLDSVIIVHSVNVRMYVPKLLAAFGMELRQTKILENKGNRSKVMEHDQSEHFNSENSRESVRFSEKFEKSRTSAEKKISKFLGNLPSEQIFYRNVTLGAPEIINPIFNRSALKGFKLDYRTEILLQRTIRAVRHLETVYGF